MNKYAIIVAGGIGTRMQSNLPKQFILLAGKPVLMHTLTKFFEADKSIRLVLVLPQNHIDYWKELTDQYKFDIPHLIAVGGETRYHSVKNGLQLITTEGLVAVHDAVRPVISANFINRLFDHAAIHGSAIPVIPVNDSLRYMNENKHHAVDRLNYRMVQTPQVFASTLVLQAFEQAFIPAFTDEATVVEHMGKPLSLTEGEYGNIKITAPADLLYAEIFLKTNI